MAQEASKLQQRLVPSKFGNASLIVRRRDALIALVVATILTATAVVAVIRDFPGINALDIVSRLAVLFVALPVAFWSARWLVSEPKAPQPPNRVGFNLFQSGSLRSGTTYESLNVDLIFDLSYNPGYVPPVPIGSIYMNWPVEDRNLPKGETLDLIARSLAVWTMEMRVLVKCDLGVNRSGLLVAKILAYQEELLTAALEKQGARVFNDHFAAAIAELRKPHPVDPSMAFELA